MTAPTLHDVLYTIYIVLCIFYYLDVLITKYGATITNWWAVLVRWLRPLPHIDEPQVSPRTPAIRRSTRRSQ